jgi:hypothetical protein
MRAVSGLRTFESSGQPRCRRGVVVSQRVERPAAPSKSHARNAQRSSRKSAYIPRSISPTRRAVTTSSVSASSSRSGLRTFCAPPRTAGLQPLFPMREFSHLVAYTSSRPLNSERKSTTLSDGDEAWSTEDGRRVIDSGTRSIRRGLQVAMDSARPGRPRPSSSRIRAFSRSNSTNRRRSAAVLSAETSPRSSHPPITRPFSSYTDGE